MKKSTVILDIDGILADYRLGLLLWINTHYPQYRETCYRHLSRIDTWINHKSMNVSFREWLDILERFRMSGGKLTIPEFPGAKLLLEFCKQEKYRIVLVTSRPFDIYSTIYKDTLEWLEQRKFNYSMILFSKSKADIIYKLRLVDDIAFTVDDELSHALQYSELGLKSYWVNHYKTEIYEKPRTLIEVYNLQSIIANEVYDEIKK